MSVIIHIETPTHKRLFGRRIIISADFNYTETSYASLNSYFSAFSTKGLLRDSKSQCQKNKQTKHTP